ncbi:hypothetical protein C5167_031726 [Papaver somniferum]|uniref:Uncharacterized protein n=1 Tax=Papaver somniferum TaxID=3469 RepID=A0A4Y7K567_PAPSO|nr:hypothetical protein C5167_031726 [Papaver somniferum]
MDEFSGYGGIIVELPLVIYASVARILFDLDVEPPFGNLLVLSSSFHEFWGKKWNKVASSLLRPLVYEPVPRITKRGWGGWYVCGDLRKEIFEWEVAVQLVGFATDPTYKLYIIVFLLDTPFA